MNKAENPLHIELVKEIGQLEDHVTFARGVNHPNIRLSIEDAEEMIKTLKTIHFHLESLFQQTSYDGFRKNDLFETIGKQSRQLGEAMKALNYIAGVPHNWEESYSNGYTTCILKAIEGLERIREFDSDATK